MYIYLYVEINSHKLRKKSLNENVLSSLSLSTAEHGYKIRIAGKNSTVFSKIKKNFVVT